MITPEKTAEELRALAKSVDRLPKRMPVRGEDLSRLAFLLEKAAAEVSTYERPLDEDVFDFQLKLGFPVASRPTLPYRDVIDFRIRLIEEECGELIEALRARDLGRIAQEGVDLVYVVMGTFVTLGLSFKPFWRLVHRANMKKEPCPQGGKAVKPEGWEKPDCGALLGEVVDLDPLETDRQKGS